MSKARGRPAKVRKISQRPRTLQFSPRGNPGRPDEVELSQDQLEALRLGDWQGLSQSSAANMMGVSRSSFGRILRSARKRAADALVHGKMIRIIEGKVILDDSPKFDPKSKRACRRNDEVRRQL